MFGLFLAGTFLWPVFFVEIVLAIFFIATYNLNTNDNSGFYSLVVTSALAYIGLVYLYGFPIPSAFHVLLYTALYVITGILWSFIKWYLYSHNASNIAYQRNQWLKYSKSPATPALMLASMEEFIKSSSNPLNPRYGQARWMVHHWIVYWPLSILGTLIGDILIDGIQNLQKALTGIYIKISGGTKNLD